MTTRYTVVQYYPNPLSGERINVGLIVWGQGRIACRFVRDWQRVRAFGHEDTKFIRDFARSIEGAASTMPELPGVLDNKINQAELEKIIGTWINSIQFSEPRSSLLPFEKLMDEIASTFLRETKRQHNRGRDRRVAASIAAQSISSVLQQKYFEVDVDQLVKRNHPIKGKFDQHEFDVAVANGKPFLAVQALSFEIGDRHVLQREVDATAWAIDDVKSRQKEISLAVIALPPLKGKGDNTEMFERAQRIFNGLKAPIKRENELDQWAKKAVNKIPRDAFDLE